jgi:hypothetical protein
MKQDDPGSPRLQVERQAYRSTLEGNNLVRCRFGEAFHLHHPAQHAAHRTPLLERQVRRTSARFLNLIEKCLG